MENYENQPETRATTAGNPHPDTPSGKGGHPAVTGKRPGQPGTQRRFLAIIGAALVSFAAILSLLFFVVLPPSSSQKERTFNTELALSTALTFSSTAKHSPTEAFSRFATSGATEHFRIIGERVWQTVSPELGWRWLFHGALMALSPPQPGGLTNQTIIGWYHPWSDTTLLTLWTISDEAARIADCEFVMGDILRKRNLDKPSTTRAWARRRQYFPAAIGITTAESLRSIELLTFHSNLPAEARSNIAALTNPPGSAGPAKTRFWRQRLPFVLSPSNLAANHTGSGVMLLASISDITRFSAPTNVFAIRVVPTLQQLHSPSNLLTIGPEAAATIKTLPKDFFGRFVPALYANNRQRAFLMLQSKTDPKLCLAFLFKLEPPDGKELTPDDEKKLDEARTRQITALTNLDEVGTNETPEQMYPEAHYPIKLIRADLINLDAVYTNRYPETKGKK